MSLEHEDLTGMIIGAAIEVHKTLGPGFVESIYEKALVLKLISIGLKVEQQKEISVYYMDQLVGKHRLDLLIENTIIVENKVVKSIDETIFTIVRSYLKSTGLKQGLILNFAKPTLEIKRVVYDPEYNYGD